MRFGFSLLTVLLLLALPLAGCGDTGRQPLTPPSPALATAPLSESVNELTGLGLLEIDLDLESLTATTELLPVPSRTGQVGLESVNLTSYLSAKPCGDCLKVSSIRRLPDGQLALGIAIRHPFPPGDTALPPSAGNRLDLHVYNVEGVVLVNDFLRKTTFPGIGQTAADLLVSNADGYSGNLTPALLGPLGLGLTVYPYKVFFRDYTQGNFSASAGYADVAAPRGYMVMGMGSPTDTKVFHLRLPSTGTRKLYVYAQAAWGVANQPPGSLLAPIYRIPEFTKKAASELTATITVNNLVGGDPASTATLRLKALDTNADATVGSGLGQLDQLSQVAQIEVEVPALMNGKITVANPVPVQGQPRNINNPLTYDIVLTNQKSAANGTYLGLVKMKDSYPAGQTGSPLDGKDVLDQPGQASPLEFARTLTDYSTYCVFSVEVGAGGGCPTTLAFVDASPTDPVLGQAYAYTFTASGGTPPYTYSLASGTLPDGITLAATGLLAGIANDRADFFSAYPMQVRVSDSCSTPKTATVDLTLRVDLRKLTMVFFDVGQGQSTLVYSESREAILMDCGPGNFTLGKRIQTYILSRGLTLKYIVDSHFHEDHHGNVAYILCGPDNEPGVRNVDDDNDGSTDNFEDREEYGWPGSDDLLPVKAFDNGNDDLENTQSDRIWQAAVWRNRVAFSPALLGDKALMNLTEPGLEMILGTGNMALFNGTNFGRNEMDENSNSLSVVFNHGAFDAEVGGDLQGTNGGDSTDMETSYAAALVASGITLDLTTAHHHGSSDGNNSVWFSSLRPEIIVISCDDDNPYGHPHQQVLDRIGTNLGSTLKQVYMTTGGTLLSRTLLGVPIQSSPLFEIANGDIVLETDGRTYTITTPNGQNTHNVDRVLP